MSGPFSSYDAAALGQDNDFSSIIRHSAVPALHAPAVEISAYFPYQSYFDSTAQAQALLSQPQSDQIVQSTKSKPIMSSGYGVGLHPMSEAPVAIRFFEGDQSSSQTYRLVPGQIIRPFGSPGGKPGAFAGFEFGLPVGWLGGGQVLLVILRTPDASVDWPKVPREIVFHRLRLQILAPASLPDPTSATTLVPNWPTRFPWVAAARLQSSVALSQAGPAAMIVQPTRIRMRLLLNTLAIASDMRMIMVGDDVFDLGGDFPGLTRSLTTQSYFDMTWPVTANLVGSVNLTTQRPVVEPNYATALMANNGVFGGMVLSSEAAALQTQYVDIVRYGILG